MPYEKVDTDIMVGHIVVMESAGGWGYNHNNNGCYAVVTAVRPRIVRETWETIEIDGETLNPNDPSKANFMKVPVYQRHESDGKDGGKWTIRPATQTEIDMREWEGKIEEIEI
jgi:hypothetical protein